MYSSCGTGYPGTTATTNFSYCSPCPEITSYPTPQSCCEGLQPIPTIPNVPPTCYDNNSSSSPCGNTNTNPFSYGSANCTSSPYRNTNTNQSSYGNANCTSSPYGNTNTNQSSYGNANCTSSPYPNTNTNQSSYGNANCTSSPYGNTNTNQSSYGNANCTSSPYGNTNTNSSPYGNDNCNSSPYGSPQGFPNNATFDTTSSPCLEEQPQSPNQSTAQEEEQDRILDERLNPRNPQKEREPPRPRRPPLPALDNPPNHRRTCCPGKNYVPPQRAFRPNPPFNPNYFPPNNYRNDNSCQSLQTPSQRLQNVDVQEELRYFMIPESGGGGSDGGDGDDNDDDCCMEGFDCYRLSEDGCEYELICCSEANENENKKEDKKDSKKEKPKEPEYKPATYTRKQRFTFKDQGGSKRCVQAQGSRPNWPFPETGNNGSSNGCNCNGDRSRGKESKKEKGKESKKENEKKKEPKKSAKTPKSRCEDILPGKSGYYEFKKTTNQFISFPEERMVPKQPQIIIQPAPPPPPYPGHPMEDIQIIDECEEDEEEEDVVLQPIIQPIIMSNTNPYALYNNPCNPCNPCNPYMNPFNHCNPCGNACNTCCCNNNNNCCGSNNNNNNNQNNNNQNNNNHNNNDNRNNSNASQIPGFGNGISISGKEYSTGNPVIPMCIPMMPPQQGTAQAQRAPQRKCCRRPPYRPPPPYGPYGYRPPYGCGPPCGMPGMGQPGMGMPGMGMPGMGMPGMGNPGMGMPGMFGAPFGSPQQRGGPGSMHGHHPPPPQNSHQSHQPKSTSRKKSSVKDSINKKTTTKSSYKSSTKSSNKLSQNSQDPHSFSTHTPLSFAYDPSHSTNTKSSFYSDNIIVPGIPGSALGVNAIVATPPGLYDLGPSDVVIQTGEELVRQAQHVDRHGHMHTTIGLQPGRGDNIQVVATDRPAAGNPKVNVMAYNANTQVKPAVNPAVNPTNLEDLIFGGQPMGGDGVRVLVVGSPVSTRGGIVPPETPSDIRALKVELEKFLPKGSFGGQSIEHNDAGENNAIKKLSGASNTSKVPEDEPKLSLVPNAEEKKCSIALSNKEEETRGSIALSNKEEEARGSIALSNKEEEARGSIALSNKEEEKKGSIATDGGQAPDAEE